MGRGTSCLLIVFVLSIAAASPSSAQWKDQGPVFTVIEENDLFLDTDRHYTQGFKQSFLHTDGYLPGWAQWISEHIPVRGFDLDTHKFGYQMGQSIFTPTDLRATQLLKDDRPYAGWLYTGVILQRRGMLHDRWPVLENFQIDAGIIGRHSMAEEAQIGIHEWRGFDSPKGWRNQIHDEPGIALKYERSWIFSPTRDGARWIDLIPRAGLSLGNVDTSFRIGAMLRLGVNLPNDFGVETISSLTTPAGGRAPNHAGREWGFYVFGGGEASTVLYTAFLDGNLFRHSHHVEKEPFVGEWKAGAVAVLNLFELGVTYAIRSPQFVGQRKVDGYGSISAKIRF